EADQVAGGVHGDQVDVAGSGRLEHDVAAPAGGDRGGIQVAADSPDGDGAGRGHRRGHGEPAGDVAEADGAAGCHGRGEGGGVDLQRGGGADAVGRGQVAGRRDEVGAGVNAEFLDGPGGGDGGRGGGRHAAQVDVARGRRA